MAIKGNSIVRGLVDGQPQGGVFGGGDESAVMGNCAVTIECTPTSDLLDVYGGGNLANVGGNTHVIIGPQ